MVASTFSGQAGEAQVLLDPLVDAGQGLAEVDHPVELAFVADLAEARVVAVLLAPARVLARRLEVAVGQGADPDAFVGGRGWRGSGCAPARARL